MEIYFIRRILSYVGCIVAVCIGGQAWLIILYRGWLARHFSLSPSEENYVIIAGVLGSSFSLPVAYIIHYIGPRWAMVTSVFITCLGLTSVWTATVLSYQYQPPSVTLALCFFVASMGPAMSFLTGVSTVLNNVTRRHKAMVCAIMGMVYEASTQCFQLIRRLGLTYGVFEQFQDPEVQQDIIMSRLTLTMLVFTLLGSVIAVPCIKGFQESRYLDGADDKGLICALGICVRHFSTRGQELTSTNVLQWKSSLSLWRILATFECQCLIWSSGLFLALAQFSRISLPPVTPNASVTNDVSLYLTCIYSASAIMSRFPFAILLDTYNEQLFVYLALLFVKILGVLGHLLLFMEWNTFVMVTFYMISGIVDGACMFEVLVLTCQMFGYERLARNIALPLMAKSVVIAVLEYIHNTVSDNSSFLHDPSETYCYGRNCEVGTNLIRLGLALLAVAVFVPLICLRSDSFRCGKCKSFST